MTLESVGEGFGHPVALTEAPDGSGRLFVTDQVGMIRIIEPDGSTRAEPFLDISMRLVEIDESYDERGLLGTAFHPDYAENGRATRVGTGHPAAGDPLIAPVIELTNSGYFDDGVGIAIVGGVVNRGQALTSRLDGHYLFGMWSVGEYETGTGEVHQPGKLLVARMRSRGDWSWEPARLVGSDSGMLDAYLLGFGQNEAGDVYVLTSEDVGPTGTSGKVRRIVAASPE